MLDVFLPTAEMSVWAPGIVLLGLLIGILTGMFGAGGGFIITPLLKIVFGVPYPIAVGSGLLLIVFNASQSTFRHWRKGSVDVPLGFVMVAGAVVGAEIGVRIMDVVGGGGMVTIGHSQVKLLDLVMNSLFLVLLTSVAISILREAASGGGSEETQTNLSMKLRTIGVPPVMAFKKSGIDQMSIWAPLGLAFIVGILTGLLGVGGGFVNFPLLVYVVGVPTLVAVGTSAFQIVFASAYGAFRHASQGHVELILVGLLLVGSVVGVQIGVRVSHLFGGRKVRKYFAFVLLLGVVFVVWDLIKVLL